MAKSEQILRSINDNIAVLVEIGMSMDQNFAIQRSRGSGVTEVTFETATHLSYTLKDRNYAEIYDVLRAERAFSVLLPDGALIQMNYEFVGGALRRHRLSFMPSPYLEVFQNDPELYLEDVIYADIVAKSIVPFPFRFDFDAREGVHNEITHPKSHLTLGQYQNCRIPVTSPLTPGHFIRFVLRNFYNTAFNSFEGKLPAVPGMFTESIRESERKLIHVTIPGREAS